MDKKTLKQHRKNKARIQRIDARTAYLCAKDIEVVNGKVTGSSEDFPYTEVRTSVQMYQPEENDRVNAEIRRLAGERIMLQEKVDEVEQYISEMPDAETREIFEMYFEQGKTQTEIGEIIGTDRSRISRKIDDYIKTHTKHKMDML